MIESFLGTKIKQRQFFTDAGQRIPVTDIVAGPCWITQIGNQKHINWIQIGFSQGKNINNARLGHLKKAGLELKKLRFLHNIRVDSITEDLKVGQELTVSEIFKSGDEIVITAVSKGKGFSGVVKRHNFKGGPRTHGQSDRERAPGSIGQTTTPGRVYKGKKMAGRLGGNRITVAGLKVIAIDPVKNILTVKGLVPGGRNNKLIISKRK